MTARSHPLRHAADFPCCAPSLSRTCRHHYPGGTERCVSRSLPSRRRPSPLLGRVGSHIRAFEACSVFTHIAARTVHWPPKGAFSQSASGHSSPPDPPRVFPAGARVRRPGFPPGRMARLGKAHPTTAPSEPCGPAQSIARSPTGSAPNGAPDFTPIFAPSSKRRAAEVCAPSTPSVSRSPATPFQLSRDTWGLSNYEK